MHTNRQIFFNNVSTLRTKLTCILGINFYNLTPSVFCFGNKGYNKDIPRSIHNAFRKMMILNKAFSQNVW